MADFLQDWIDAALSRASQFDAERIVWTACALLLAASLYYVVVSSAWLRLLFTWRDPLAHAIGLGRERGPHDAYFKPLKPGSKHGMSLQVAPSQPIHSPHRSYRPVRPLSDGDVSDVSLIESGDRQFVLKQSRSPCGDELLQREYRVLEQLLDHSDDTLYGHYLPWPVESFSDGGRRATIFDWRDGFVGAVAVARRFPRGLDGRHLAWMFKRLLEVLGHAHQLGWVHGGLLPPHLLFHPANHGLQLLGWTHTQRIGQPLAFAPTRYRDWYPPECHARRPATAATDLYLAARCMLWLACGNDLQTSFPHQVPRPIRHCLESCLSTSPTSRPQDAWGLHRYFTELLEQVYGPPRFCRLDVS